MKSPKIVLSGIEWHRSAVARMLVVLMSLVSLVLASGAGYGWF